MVARDWAVKRGEGSYPPSSSTHYICNSGVILGSYWHYTFLTSPCLPLPLKERSIGNCSWDKPRLGRAREIGKSEGLGRDIQARTSAFLSYLLGGGGRCQVSYPSFERRVSESKIWAILDIDTQSVEGKCHRTKFCLESWGCFKITRNKKYPRLVIYRVGPGKCYRMILIYKDGVPWVLPDTQNLSEGVG